MNTLNAALPEVTQLPTQIGTWVASAGAATLAGQRAVGQLASLCENQPQLVTAVLAQLPARAQPAPVVGFTGPPGVGKSTFAAHCVAHWQTSGERVAVLAVDPSSQVSGGAILGDRIRFSMTQLGPGGFFRSVANRGALGGLALSTAGLLAVLQRCGFDRIAIETVGVGQSEVDIAAFAHPTVAVLAPGLGDGIQAVKSGLMEVVDVVVMNQADRPGATQSCAHVKSGLRTSGRTEVPVVTADSRTATGAQAAVAVVAAATATPGRLSYHQAERQVQQIVAAQRWAQLATQPTTQSVVAAVAQGELSAWSAAEQLLLRHTD